jgi:hypothetical protein
MGRWGLEKRRSKGKDSLWIGGVSICIAKGRDSRIVAFFVVLFWVDGLLDILAWRKRAAHALERYTNGTMRQMRGIHGTAIKVKHLGTSSSLALLYNWNNFKNQLHIDSRFP